MNWNNYSAVLTTITTGVKGVKHTFMQRAVLPSTLCKLTLNDSVWLLVCDWLYFLLLKNIRNVDIYCTVLSGSATMHLRWGWRFHSSYVRWSLLIEVVKELLKSPINRNQRCRKNKSGPVFLVHAVYSITPYPFRHLTFLVGWQEGHLACRNLAPAIP